MSDRREAIARSVEAGRELVAPCPGVVVRAPERGALVRAGHPFAALEVLGRVVELVAPAGAGGVVGEAARPGEAVGHGSRLATLGAAELAGAVAPEAKATASGAALALRATSSGRFYRRAAPGQPAFVEDGATVQSGQTVGLLEVMKTFSRIHYGGDSLPASARVVRVVPADGADVEVGDVLLELELELG